MSDTAHSISIIGSGNWGSAIARIVGENVKNFKRYNNSVRMWVFEEEVDGKKLTEIINETHENVKYLPGMTIPDNVVAVPDLAEAVRGADILIFVLPHQFLPRLLPVIKENMCSGAVAVSLIKGLDFDDKGMVLISENISRGLEVPCSVLMGANVANEVARGEFCEATLGCADPTHSTMLKPLFDTETFRISTTDDRVGVELCGALKNVVALGAGFVDGLGFGGNTKAAIIRIGLVEMIKICKHFFPDTQQDTFFESCGVADVITTCYNGRNRRCAEAFVKTGKSWKEVEEELLSGQKLQGTLTSEEVHAIMERLNIQEQFPFFETVYKIAFEGEKADTIVQMHLHRPAAEDELEPATARACAAKL